MSTPTARRRQKQTMEPNQRKFLRFAMIFRGLGFLTLCWFGVKQHELLSAASTEYGSGMMVMAMLMSKKQDQANAQHSHLTHVVIPFHESQLGKLSGGLRKWLPPCDENYHYNTNKPTLVFHVTFSPRRALRNWEGVEKDVRHTVNKRFPESARRCFDGDPIVVSQKLTRFKDTYLAGSRLMLEALFHGRVVPVHGRMNNKTNDNPIGGNRTTSTKPAQYILYMEPDVVTIRPGWLQRIAEEVASTSTTSRFWMMGSIFRGVYDKEVQASFLASRPFANHYHINGNAIYNLQTMHGHDNLHGGGFPQFYLDTLSPYIANKTRWEHNGEEHAYDTNFYDYLLDLQNYETAREVLSYFRYTPLIQNLWHTNWSAAEVARKYPETVLVHGGTNLDDPIVIDYDDSDNEEDEAVKQGEKERAALKDSGNEDDWPGALPLAQTIAEIAKRKARHERRHNNRINLPSSLEDNTVIILQVINSDLVEQTESWICNVRRFPRVLESTLFVATDREAYQSLRRFDQKLNLAFETPLIDTHKRENGKNVLIDISKAYNLMLSRANLIVKLLEVGRYNVWVTQSDAVWFKDPTTMVVLLTGSGADMVAMNLDHNRDTKKQLVHTGFCFLRPTPGTRSLWGKFRDELRQGNHIDTTGNNIMRKLVGEALVGDLNIGWLDPQQFVLAEDYYSKRAPPKEPRLLIENDFRYPNHAVVLNNERNRGDATGMVHRAKQWGHWFLNDQGQCIHSQK